MKAYLQYLTTVCGAGIAITDLVINGKVETTWPVIGLFLAIAAGRQAHKSIVESKE